MISYDQMPDDNRELCKIAISFPRLPDDSAQGCPASLENILDYLALEVPDGELLKPSDLRFLRTAEVEGTEYWIWEFNEPDGTPAYVTVSKRIDGTVTTSYDANDFGLTPEQFILGDYYNVF